MTAAADAGPRRRGRPARSIALGLGIVLAGLVLVLATRPAASTRVADSPLVGRPAPEVTAETIDGGTYRLASERGRWVLVNFFATWCVPCRTEHPELIRFARRHAATGDLNVVGIVYDDSVDAVRSFRDAEGGDWPMLVDPDGKIALNFGVAGVPESYLIAPSGIIAARIVGGVRADALEELLGQAQRRAR